MMKLLGAATVLAMSVPAAAQSYDAFSSFNGTQGAGNFYYGQVGAAGTGPGLFAISTNCFIDNSVCLQAAANHDVPGVTKSATYSFQYNSVDVPTDRLLLHPANSSDLTFAAFQALAAGTYAFTGTYNIQDRYPTGVTISTFTAPSLGAAFTLTPRATINGAATSGSYSQQVALTSGQVFGFAFGNGGLYYNDSTGFNFSASAVPEPASWGMMIVGFGAMGVMMRRRRRPTRAQAAA